MRTGWIEGPRHIQQRMRLCHTRPRIGIYNRRDNDPVRPGLGNHGIRLCTIQQILALLGRLLDLFDRASLLQCLIGGVQLTLQLVHFLPEGYKLMACVFVFPQRDNGLGHFFRIDL
jgi:hypothetical protein